MIFAKNRKEREYDWLDRMIDWEDALCLHEIDLMYIKMGREIEEIPYKRRRHSRAERREYILDHMGDIADKTCGVFMILFFAMLVLKFFGFEV